VTLSQAADESLSAAQAGLVRNRSGDPYKPSALRGYEQALRARLLPPSAAPSSATSAGRTSSASSTG